MIQRCFAIYFSLHDFESHLFLNYKSSYEYWCNCYFNLISIFLILFIEFKWRFKNMRPMKYKFNIILILLQSHLELGFLHYQYLPIEHFHHIFRFIFIPLYLEYLDAQAFTLMQSLSLINVLPNIGVLILESIQGILFWVDPFFLKIFLPPFL